MACSGDRRLAGYGRMNTANPSACSQLPGMLSLTGGSATAACKRAPGLWGSYMMHHNSWRGQCKAEAWAGAPRTAGRCCRSAQVQRNGDAHSATASLLHETRQGQECLAQPCWTSADVRRALALPRTWPSGHLHLLQSIRAAPSQGQNLVVASHCTHSWCAERLEGRPHGERASMQSSCRHSL